MDWLRLKLLCPTPLCLCFAATIAVNVAFGWGDPIEGRPVMRVFTPTDYRTDSPVECVAQDAAGRMCFGSNVLLRYNGDSWQQFPAGRAIQILALDVDTQGRLWIGALDDLGYFEPDAKDGLSFHSLRSRLPKSALQSVDVWGVACTATGVVFTADDKIMHWDGRSFQIWPMPKGRRAASQRIGDTTFSLNMRTGLWRVSGKTLQSILPASDPTGAGHGVLPLFVQPLPDGSLLSVTSSGVGHIADGKLQVLRGDGSHYIAENIPTCALQFDPHTFAVGTYQGGLVFVSDTGRLVRAIDRRSGLPEQTVNSCMIDREGTLWVTGDRSIVAMEGSGAVTMFDAANRLTGKGVRALAVVNGSLAVVTTDGMFFERPAQPGGAGATFELSAYRDLNRLGYAGVVATPAGLLSSGFAGIRLLRPDGSIEAVQDSASDVWVLHQSRRFPDRCYYLDNRGLEWLTLEGARWQPASVHVPLSESVTILTEDAVGAVWAGSIKDGVYRVVMNPAGDPGAVTHYTLGGALPPDAGRIRVASLGPHVLLFTQHGVLVPDAARTRFLPVAGLEGVWAGRALSEPDPAGRIWVAAENRGTDGAWRTVIGSVTLDAAGQPIWRVLEVPGLSHAGAPTECCWQMASGGREVLWIGGSEALLEVDLQALPAPAQPFQTLLRSVRSLAPGNEPEIPLAQASAPRLPFAANHLEFAFAAATFRNPDSVRYQTRLLGFDQQWSEGDTRTSREFTNLHEGSYTFEVRAMGVEERSGTMASFRFVILPPWYRTRWAYSCFAFFGAASLLAVHRLRVRQMTRRNRQLESLVRQRTDQLNKANAAKTDFIANMSHEIRNPLNGVVGLAGLIHQESPTPRLQELARSLRTCAHYLSTLVEDVLDFAKIEAGEITIDAHPFSPRGLVDDVISILAWQSQEKAMPLEVQWEPGVPESLLGDELKIRQIVINYVGNALKYAGAGTVTIAGTARVAPGGIELSIGVQDQGPGIPPEEQGKLFERFARGAKARAERVSGTGLGLAVCRAYAERMGGAVGVESIPGRGARFWLRLVLPVAPAPAPGASAGSRRAPGGPQPRALIVEDQEYNILVIENILTRLGYRPDHATDGPSALAKMKASAYDIVFMDWDLPGMSGVEVTRAYRQWEGTEHHALIVATTAYSSPEKRRECMVSGMDGFAAKPLSPDKIIATLHNLSGPLRGASSIQIRTPAPTPAAEGVPDLSMFEYMADRQPGRLSELVEQFIHALDEDLDRLRHAIQEGTSDATRRYAHRILSQTAMVHATRLTEVLKQIQDAASQADQATPRGVLPTLQVEVNRLKDGLQPHRLRRGP
jgi:signal transduction histidine kinase